MQQQQLVLLLLLVAAVVATEAAMPISMEHYFSPGELARIAGLNGDFFPAACLNFDHRIASCQCSCPSPCSDQFFSHKVCRNYINGTRV
uniref:Uncharacterized protein n=1 Tax=Oryza brachyantha TaxID=4533 RepID=J3KVI7_ORYBR